MLGTNKEIISRLKFIGRLQKGEKVNTKHMYVQPDGLTTTLSRTFFNQDNRGNALTFVQETVTRSFELFTTFERSDTDSDRAMCKHIIQDIRQAQQGLGHLKDTYINDVKFSCDMDTLLQVIDAKIAGVTDRFPELHEAIPSVDDRPPAADELTC